MTKNSKKEILIIIISFSIIFLLTLISKYLSFQQINTLNSIVSDIYQHPLQVSNAALSIKSNVYKIHDSMQHTLHTKSEEEVASLYKQINEIEKNTYENFDLIKKYILGKEGLQILEDTKKTFNKCKIIRSEVFSLLKDKKIVQATAMVEEDGMENTLLLLDASDLIYAYAQNKASEFVKKSQKSFIQIKFLNYEIGFVLLILFIIIIYYTLKRIATYMDKNEHLTGVLSVIRDVNQLIIREKDEKILLEKTSEILTSTEVYSNVWIMIYDENHNPKYCVSTDRSEKIDNFRKKILNSWIPNCINKTLKNNADYSSIQNPLDECSDCLLKNSYQTKNAFNIKLQYKNKLYGFLTLALSEQFIDDENEIKLLEEVAGDISYALYNLRNENEVNRIKELYDYTLNSIENLIFVKDTNFTYITCNNSFEKFIGKPKEEIIGKTDYDLFDKEIANRFRGYDMIMLSQKISKSNFEWVTYPDGTNIYLLTTKAPLQNEQGEVLGLVGNSVDITKQKTIEDTLKLVNYRFETTEHIGHVGSWEYDIESETFWGSNEAKRIYGFKEKDKIFTTQNVERCIPEKQRVHQALVDLIEKGTKYDLEFEIKPLNQNKKKIIHSIAKIEHDTITHKKKVRGFIADITKQKENWVLLEQKKKELETIIQEAPTPIMLHNEEGEVILINKAWEKLTGYTYEEINTIEKWTQKAHGKDMAIIKKHIRSLYDKNQDTSDEEYKIITKNDETLIWKFHSTILGNINGTKSVISSAMDVTELKHKEELLINQSRHAAMGEMISMIAHQWRQPLSIISMSANNMLLDIDLNTLDVSEVEKFSNNIVNQTIHLSKTIDDFSNFFKPEKTVSKIKIETILNETYNIVKDSLVNNNIQYLTNIESHIEVNAYQRELMQVFLNIINNSKYALIERKIENAFIHVNVYDDKKYIHIEFYDNAHGIDEKILSKVFEPYFTTKNKNGTGLGLYMSKMIIEKHLNGNIDVKNTDVGVCFKVSLLIDNPL